MANNPPGYTPVPFLSVTELFDTLSRMPRLLECPECGSTLLHREAVLSYNRQVWTLQLAMCPSCDLEYDGADTSAAA